MTTIQEQAKNTLDQLKRVGWTRGTLYSASQAQDEGVAPTECRMCVLGAAATVFYGNPNRGYDFDGNGYDKFVAALADELHPGWRTDTYSDGLPKYSDSDDREVVYNANDTEGQDYVFAALERLAAKGEE